MYRKKSNEKLEDAAAIQFFRKNVEFAKRQWQSLLTRDSISVLKALTGNLRLSVPLGELRLLDGTWYVTHAGLLRLATRNRCSGIRTELLREFCDASVNSPCLKPKFVWF